MVLGLWQVIRPYPSSLSLARGINDRWEFKTSFVFYTQPPNISLLIFWACFLNDDFRKLQQPWGASVRFRFRRRNEAFARTLETVPTRGGERKEATARLDVEIITNHLKEQQSRTVGKFCDSNLSILHKWGVPREKPYSSEWFTQNWFYHEVSFIKLCLKECHSQTRIWWISTFVAWCFCPYYQQKIQEPIKRKIQHRHYSNTSEENES